jgi:hypothetical protein
MRITRQRLKSIIHEEAMRLGKAMKRCGRLLRESSTSGVQRLESLAARFGYKVEAPYTWGRDSETGEEFESGSVKFDAAIVDDYDSWIVGLEGNDVVLHTADDDITMTLDQVEKLFTDNDIETVLDMTEDEITDLIDDVR